MKHTVEKNGASKVKVTTEVDKKTWQDAQEKAFQKAASKVTVKGFRPGKAPRALLEQHVSEEAVFTEAVDSLLNPVLMDIISTEKIEPFLRPSVNVSKLSKDELTLVYDIVTRPTVKLGQYKGLSAKKEVASVTEKEVDEAIDNLLSGNASLNVVDRPAKEGDTVVLDFKGSVSDEKGELVPFDGGSAENYSLELGSHQFVPGFEEALVGVKPGERKSIKVTFPEAYVKELAGKEATFDCLVHEVKEKKVPELTDEAVKDLGIKDVDGVEALREYEKKNILSRKAEQADEAYYQALIDKIIAASEYEIADEVIESEADALLDNLKKQVSQNGLTFEQYLEITKQTEESLKGGYRPEAERNIKGFLALNEIANAEKIEVSVEDVSEEAKRLAQQYGAKEEDVRKVIDNDLERWKGNIRDRKIRDFVLKNSKIEHASGKPKEEPKAHNNKEEKKPSKK
jgi:trigger factor